MLEKSSISFYDPKDLVLGDKRVTLRLAKEGDDKYDHIISGQGFIIDMPEEDNEELVQGTILGHWKLPFGSIPIEYLLGEGYDIDINPEEDTQQIVGWLLRQKARRDLEQYYKLDSNTLFHVIVYTPEEVVDDSLLQKEDESATEWVTRVGHKVFSHIHTYEELGKCDVI